MTLWLGIKNMNVTYWVEVRVTWNKAIPCWLDPVGHDFTKYNNEACFSQKTKTKIKWEKLRKTPSNGTVGKISGVKLSTNGTVRLIMNSQFLKAGPACLLFDVIPVSRAGGSAPASSWLCFWRTRAFTLFSVFLRHHLFFLWRTLKRAKDKVRHNAV